MTQPDHINIAGLDKAAVLLALYANAAPQGMGWLADRKGDGLSAEQAQGLIDSSGSLYFDYVGGRSCKVDLSGTTLDPRLYDRDNGQGAARRALEGAGLVAG